MAPIALGIKQQDLLKAYLEVSKSEKPDWTSIAAKANLATAKYARDSFGLAKKKILATPNGEPIDLSDVHLILLQTVIGVLKTNVDWEKVASVANFKTPKYARDSWNIVKNKLGSASAAATPTSSKATPSRKRKKLEADDEAGEEEPTLTARDDTPSKKAKTPKAPKWKETQKKAAVKKVKSEVEESEAEADADADAEAKVEVDEDAEEQSRETPGVQAQVDEQIKAEMQEDLDDQFDDADMFRMD
ncbi:hypothetical protein Q7P36_008541 [Cladosporium allicinum]